jgi:hypothetical protein
MVTDVLHFSPFERINQKQEQKIGDNLQIADDLQYQKGGGGSFILNQMH